MISALWLIPATLDGAAWGIFAIAIAAGRDEYDL